MILNQTKLESFVESLLNTLSGFVISWLAWAYVVGPLFGIPVNLSQSFWITFVFTFISLGRNYVVRRMFVGGFHRAAIQIVESLKEKHFVK